MFKINQKITYIIPSERIKITWYWPVKKVTEELSIIACEYMKLKNIHIENGNRCMILPEWYDIESF